jgi:hypothetical protein
MNRLVFGALLSGGALLGAAGALESRSEVFAERPAGSHQVGPSSELLAWPTPVGESGQLLTVVDPKRRVIAVYHIDLGTGKIALRGVRNIQFDLQMSYLNCEHPLPGEIQSLLQQR